MLSVINLQYLESSQAAMSGMFRFTVLAMLMGFSANGRSLRICSAGSWRKEQEVKEQQLNTSAANADVAFEPYCDLN